jgi:hypothetical protein
MLEIFEVYWKGLLPNQSYVGNLFWKVLRFVGKIYQLPQGSIGKFYWKSQLDLKFSYRSKTWEYLLEATIAFFFKVILITKVIMCLNLSKYILHYLKLGFIYVKFNFVK